MTTSTGLLQSALAKAVFAAASTRECTFIEVFPLSRRDNASMEMRNSLDDDVSESVHLYDVSFRCREEYAEAFRRASRGGAKSTFHLVKSYVTSDQITHELQFCDVTTRCVASTAWASRVVGVFEVPNRFVIVATHRETVPNIASCHVNLSDVESIDERLIKRVELRSVAHPACRTVFEAYETTTTHSGRGGDVVATTLRAHVQTKLRPGTSAVERDEIARATIQAVMRLDAS